VRWNAALALATLDDASGKAVLLGMCDRAALRAAPGLSAEQQEDALLNGLRGLVLLKDPDSRSLGRRMVESDPSLRVRQEAKRILEAPQR
jgi:hypothetical protein